MSQINFTSNPLFFTKKILVNKFNSQTVVPHDVLSVQHVKRNCYAFSQCTKAVTSRLTLTLPKKLSCSTNSTTFRFLIFSRNISQLIVYMENSNFSPKTGNANIINIFNSDWKYLNGNLVNFHFKQNESALEFT